MRLITLPPFPAHRVRLTRCRETTSGILRDRKERTTTASEVGEAAQSRRNNKKMGERLDIRACDDVSSNGNRCVSTRTYASSPASLKTTAVALDATG